MINAVTGEINDSNYRRNFILDRMNKKVRVKDYSKLCEINNELYEIYFMISSSIFEDLQNRRKRW